MLTPIFRQEPFFCNTGLVNLQAGGPSATGARGLALLDLGGAQPQALLVGGLAGTGRGAQPPPRLPVPRPLGRRLHQLDQEPAAEADHPGPDHNRQGNGLGRIYRISLRPSRALDSVTSSAYSRSPPTGSPRAIRVTRRPSGRRSLAR